MKTKVSIKVMTEKIYGQISYQKMKLKENDVLNDFFLQNSINGPKTGH